LEAKNERIELHTLLEIKNFSRDVIEGGEGQHSRAALAGDQIGRALITKRPILDRILLWRGQKVFHRSGSTLLGEFREDD
jgi:hypothetical protein